MKRTSVRSISLGLAVKGTADFPVEARGVDQAADAPAVVFADGVDLRGTGGDGFGEGGVGIGDGEDQAKIFSAQRPCRCGGRFRAFIAQPKFGAVCVEANNEAAFRVVIAVGFFGGESGLVESQRAWTVGDFQPRSERVFSWLSHIEELDGLYARTFYTMNEKNRRTGVLVSL